MRSNQIISIHYRGGLVSPGHLLKVLELLVTAQISEVRFGLRQQLLIDVPAAKFTYLTKVFREHEIVFTDATNTTHNITTAYAINDIFSGDGWLTEGVYKDLLDELPDKTSLKINILDRNQSFCPWYTGHINWIASTHTHYWHLALRYPGSNEIFHYPSLLYTNHVPSVTAIIENFWKKIKGGTLPIANKYELPLEVPDAGKLAANGLPALNFQLPYYEGFNRYGSRNWLGIYRRNENFPVDYLADLCRLCLRTRVGMLYTTPWKSIIIKNIEPQHRSNWDYLLGNYRINVRHASNELNWQVEDNSAEALSLKRYIIREFDREDVRTFGLCFAVQMSRQAAMFGSIRIQRDYTFLKGTWRPLSTYSIFHTPQFDPNGLTLLPFRQGVKKEFLPAYLIGLCRNYYEALNDSGTVPDAEQIVVVKSANPPAANQAYQCGSCFTVYDPEYGDNGAGIDAGVPWEKIPDGYTCNVCDAGKETFHPVKLQAATMEV